MNRFFISDLHFNHANIIKYTGRTLFMTSSDLKIYNSLLNKSRKEQSKFIISQKSLDNMNNGMIWRWNERVKKDDVVYCIGDWCFKNSFGGKKGEGTHLTASYWENKVNGKVIFIKGNHDSNNSTKTIIERLVIKYGGRRINLTHNPEHADLNYDINFTGHIHEKWIIKRIRRGKKFTDCINVGVDVWNFMPVTFDELMSRYSKWLKRR